MRIEIPARDAPRWASVAAVAVVSLGVGLAVAAWGTRPAQDARGHERGRPPPEPSVPSRVDPGPVSAPASQDPALEVEPPPQAEPVREVAREPESTPTPASPTPSDPGELGVHRVRVAYLRCDVGTGRACPRDENVEAAVWAIVEGLMACPTPPTTAGSADLRLEYHADGAPEVGWRDTFGPDEARLDRERVLRCLSEPLSATRGSAVGERLIVSFRFRVE